MTTALIVLCVILAVALVCTLLAAYDMISQLCEDLDDAQAERDALLVVTDEQEADLATYRRNSIRSVPAASNVIDLIARNEAARHLTNERIHNWLGDWTTDPEDIA